ncbi:MAG: potassium transporter [Epulopiscium sp. Nele67-Bin005]|nr:MAG: potassium transporter [Epulopiscium sp. Nele67-Bin005]
MAESLGLILLFGIISGFLCEKLKLPKLLGYLIVGIVIGPYSLGLINENMLLISADIRRLALIVILLRAGMGIQKEQLLEVGKPAFLLSFVPGVCEAITIMLLSTQFLGFSWIQGGILGFVIAAVSPAVVVPSMIGLMEKGKGSAKNIPLCILAGASIDDIVAITLFGSFLSMYGGEVNIFAQLLNIPISIGLGLLLGIIIGVIIVGIFKMFKLPIIQSTLLLLGSSIIVDSFGSHMEEFIEIATLLSIMTIAFILATKLQKETLVIKETLGSIWTGAEIFLFVLVGAEVNLEVAMQAGLVGIVMISIGLVARSFGVYLSLLPTNFTFQEKIFCMVSYAPKATVQAAIGGIPLASGVAGGETILAIAVLSIVLTAPLGAVGIKYFGNKYLE